MSVNSWDGIIRQVKTYADSCKEALRLMSTLLLLRRTVKYIVSYSAERCQLSLIAWLKSQGLSLSVDREIDSNPGPFAIACLRQAL